MTTLTRHSASTVWGILTMITLVSWMLGTHQGASHDHVSMSAVLLVFAFFKARLVGLYFMGLRSAHPALRAAFEVWCAGCGAATLATFLMA